MVKEEEMAYHLLFYKYMFINVVSIITGFPMFLIVETIKFIMREYWIPIHNVDFKGNRKLNLPRRYL